MGFSPLEGLIYPALWRDADIASLFSDKNLVKLWLKFEVALARVQGDLALIPLTAALEIETAAADFAPDWAALQAGVARDGVPISAFLHQFRQRLTAESRAYVHWGATTQDVMDTALVLQLHDALAIINERLVTVIGQLVDLIQTHRHTIMAARTHSQHALPTTFGLKAAGWLAPLLRHHQRLGPIKGRLNQLQFGGGAGTLAALGDRGIAVEQALAAELGLAVPLLPWHTQRDNLVEVAGWLASLSGSLAKIGQDIILLGQSEVGELREAADPERGGSSTMPQKQNPVTSELLIAAARTNGSLLGNMVQAMIQEHERGSHGWQMEWLTLPQMVVLSGVAVRHAVELSRDLDVQPAVMAATVAGSHGLLLAEAANFALAAYIDRAAAKKLIEEAVAETVAGGHHLFDVLQQKTAAPIDWAQLRREHLYLGSADPFIDRTLAAAAEILP